MKWKLVYSQHPGCAYGNTITNTLECEKCDMRLAAGNSKMYIPEDMPEPIKSEIDKVEGFAEDQFVMTVTFDKPVKASDVTVVVGSQLELVSVLAGEGEEGEDVKVTVKAVEGAVPGRYNIITTYQGINRIENVVINPAPAEPDQEMELKSIELDKTTLEVGETTKATLKFDPKPEA